MSAPDAAMEISFVAIAGEDALPALSLDAAHAPLRDRLCRRDFVQPVALQGADGTDWLRAGAAFADAMLVAKVASARCLLPYGAAALASFAEGAALRAYRFDRYKEQGRGVAAPLLQIHTHDPDAARVAYAARAPVVAAVRFARDLVHEPPNLLTPSRFAERARVMLEPLGVTVEILSRAEITALGMGALLGVAQGSREEPYVVVARWAGATADKPLALVGKGVTFDSGGLQLKPADRMLGQKIDMAGAAAALGAVAALAGRRAPVDVVAVVGLVENMPGGGAFRPGDVLTAMNGRTIEIINTDAEGRLVLADLLTYSVRRFAPAAIVDLATLTGHIVIALGHDFAGLMSNDDTLAADMFAAGAASGEKAWRMPLSPALDTMLRSDIADFRNDTPEGRKAGAVLAGRFLEQFVDGTPWVHLDIAGTAMLPDDSEFAPRGATGWGVRLLERFAVDRAAHG